jgi:polysaccharide biosynthesis/export protein
MKKQVNRLDQRTNGPAHSNRGNGKNERNGKGWLFLMAAAAGLLLATAGCQTASNPSFPPLAEIRPAPLQLAEGDTVRVSFPGAPDLNTIQKIRPDGKLSLPVIGEVVAAGKRPADLQEEINELYAPHLTLKEVFVAPESPMVPVYVAGAVLRPGRISTDRRITALEAIMEAGGFDANRANLRKVKVIRQENGQQSNYDVNLKRVLNGSSTAPFHLKPNDIVYVPERIVFF